LVVSFWVGGCPCGLPVATALGSNWFAVKATQNALKVIHDPCSARQNKSREKKGHFLDRVPDAGGAIQDPPISAWLYANESSARLVATLWPDADAVFYDLACKYGCSAKLQSRIKANPLQ